MQAKSTDTMSLCGNRNAIPESRAASDSPNDARKNVTPIVNERLSPVERLMTAKSISIHCRAALI